ncbi:lipopolysaccharide biosynthesis protein [Pengzhenrongella sicca]|uniref:Lipopolysaccharide biosynthesis protein n=1 Tax=Pengzhenrongella sicca TaxID=2819238 RepID=A0A8A4ZGN2_9MICO|nr:lipopolysaccharide biosynthesis protein [Pengzhenrongella sicca]QTE29647.1 lipopolysaccharide biosynthesis protein [Pengzhenrongella sicca]
MAATLAGSAGRGVAWTTASRLVARITDLAVLMILARTLEPAAFGLAALASSILAFVDVARDLGLGQAAVQSKEFTSLQRDSLFWGALAIGVLLAGLVLATSGQIAAFLGNADAAPVIALLSASLVLASLSVVPMTDLQRSLEFRPIAIRGTLGALGGGIVGVTMALLGFGVFSLIARTLTDNFLGTVLLWASSRKPPGLHFSWPQFTNLMRFGSAVAGARTLETFVSRADDLIIGRTMGAAALGIYTIAFRIFRIMVEVFASSINQVMFPVFSRMNGEVARLQSAYYQTVRLTATAAVPVFALVAATGPWLIPLLFGNQWQESVPVMQILAILGVVQALRYYDAAIITAMGRPVKVLAVRAITGTLTVAGFVVGGFLGDLRWFALAAVLVALFVSTPIWFWLLWTTARINPVTTLGIVWKPILAGLLAVAGVTGLAQLLTGQSDLVHVAVLLPAGVVLYAGLITIGDRGSVVLLFTQLKGIRRR